MKLSVICWNSAETMVLVSWYGRKQWYPVIWDEGQGYVDLPVADGRLFVRVQVQSQEVSHA